MAAKGARTLKEMRDMPVYQLMAPVEGAASRPGPVVDGWLLPDSASAIFAEGKQNDVVTLTGYTADEGSSDARYGKRTPEEFQSEIRRFAGGAGAGASGDLADEFLKLYPASTAEQAAESQKASARDQNLVSMVLWARQRAVHAKTPVYAYLWTHPVPGPKSNVYGAHHSSELGYVFNSLSRAKRPFGPQDREIAEKTSSYWANFIRSGNPNGAGLPEWPVLDPSYPQVMELGDRFGPRPLADAAKVKLFEAIFAKSASSTGR
jgi:para-nitrobenzyl esterase